MKLFITVPGGLEELLKQELAELGAEELALTQAGIFCRASLETSYRICLWSRLATRVLLLLGEAEVDNEQQLYQAARQLPWEDHVGVEQSIAVTCTTRRSLLENSRFAALRLKDAIVDRFRDLESRRPDVDPETPDCRFHLYLEKNRAFFYLDLGGGSLHRRGYRIAGTEAPLKENLAAALLLRSGWPEIAATGGGLVDPMCGSGTFLLEAAAIAGDLAPRLGRESFGFMRWKQHQEEVWLRLLQEAKRRAAAGRRKIPFITGFDQDAAAVGRTRQAVLQAGLDNRIRVKTAALTAATAEQLDQDKGLCIINPPYGERLGDHLVLKRLYRQIGEFWQRLPGWQAGLLTSDADLARQVGFRARRSTRVMNGPLECRFYQFELIPERRVSVDTDPVRQQAVLQADMFRNRLRKNLRRIGKWARRSRVSCYRLYDRDLPEFALAVDRYQDWLHVQEYRPPARVDGRLAEARFEAAIDVILDELDVPAENVVCKQRQRQKGSRQYERRSTRDEFYRVQESGLSFWVNLHDYLDTGLFLDQRLTRERLRDMAAGKRFLNLFCYTGSASVYAAAGGAESTTSVDLSQTYLDWAGRNLRLNGFHGRRHQLLRAHCLDWLQREKSSFDLIFLDPPTFSNSKRFKGHFDIQEDHLQLLRLTMARLTKDGSLVFSTNRRNFQLDARVMELWQVEDWTEKTRSEDFNRKPPAHRCWLLRHRG